jgi:hypothetical protein
MRFGVLFATILAVCALTACGRDKTRGCESTERYATAVSSQPVQIPDDLSPPNETEALRLPPDTGANAKPPSQPCLESPPSFFGEERTGRGRPQPAAAAEPAPATPTEPPEDDGSRNIEN